MHKLEISGMRCVSFVVVLFFPVRMWFAICPFVDFAGGFYFPFALRLHSWPLIGGASTALALRRGVVMLLPVTVCLLSFVLWHRCRFLQLVPVLLPSNDAARLSHPPVPIGCVAK